MSSSSRPSAPLRSLPKRVRQLAGPVVFGLLYFVVAQLSLALVTPGGSAALWPVSGLYLGVLLRAPKRSWPALTVAALLGSITANVVAGTSPMNSVAFAFPNAVEGLLAAAAVERLAGGRVTLSRGRELVALLAGGALASAFTGLSGAAAAARVFGSPFGETWLQWWMADYVGMIAVAPLVVAGLRRPRRLPRREAIEAAMLVVGLAGATLLVFAGEPGADDLRSALPATVTLPFLLWCAWRFGPRATALAILIFAGTAGYLTAQELGPFGRPELAADPRMLGLQVFLAVPLVATFAFAAAADERGRLRGALESALLAREEVAVALGNAEAEGSRLRGRLAQIHTEKQALAHRLAGATASGVALRRDLVVRTEERDSARADVERATQETREVRNKLARTAAELAESSALRERAEERLVAATAQSEELQCLLAERTRETHALRDRFHGEAAEAKRLRQDLVRANGNARELREQLEATARELERTRSLSEREMGDARRLIAHTQSERDRLLSELRGSQAAEAHAQRALAEVRQSLVEARRQRDALATKPPPRADARLQAVLASFARGMALLAGDGRIKMGNPAFAEITGVPLERLQGMRLPELVHSAEAAGVEAGLRNFMRGSIRRVSARQRLSGSNGDVRDVRLSLSVLHDEGGEVEYLLVVEHDSSSARQLAPTPLAVASG